MKLQSLSIFSLLLLLTACSIRENDLWLQKAEQFYADKQIDSTLTYLNRIIPEKLEGEDVYTYWRIQFSTSPQPFIRHSAEKIEQLSQHYEKTKDTINLKEINHIRYRLFLYNQAYDKADSMLQIIEKKARGQQCPQELVRTYIYKTQFFKQIGKTDSALAYINKRMGIDTTHLHRKHYYREKAQTLLQLKEFGVAKEMLDSAKACAMKDKDSEFVYSLAKEYTDLYTAQGQFSEALRLPRSLHPFRPLSLPQNLLREGTLRPKRRSHNRRWPVPRHPVPQRPILYRPELLPPESPFLPTQLPGPPFLQLHLRRP